MIDIYWLIKLLKRSAVLKFLPRMYAKERKHKVIGRT